MKTDKYDWLTTFETADRTMTHTFSERVKVIVDFKFYTVTVFRDGKRVDQYDARDLTIPGYEAILVGAAKAAATLERISHE